MARATLQRAREILARERVVVVGISRAERDFSRTVFRELVSRGYDVVPVGQALSEVEGFRCYRRIQDVEPRASAALLLTPPARTEEAVRDCIEAGIRIVWMHRGSGPGAATAEAIALCKVCGIDLVTNLCPFMVLPNSGWPHRLHGLFRRTAREGRPPTVVRAILREEYRGPGTPPGKAQADPDLTAASTAGARAGLPDSGRTEILLGTGKPTD